MKREPYIVGRYILDGKIPIPCEDLLTWGRWLEDCSAERIVAQEYVGKFWISTCFLGLDHNWLSDGPPLLFETMVFRDALDEDHRDLQKAGFSGRLRHIQVDDAPCYRTPTWELALESHAQAVEWARKHQLQ